MERKYHDPFVADRYYHIYNRSINREKLFVNNENYIFFLKQWYKYLNNYLQVWSYSLIPNHFHFFVRVIELVQQIDINKLIENQFKKFFSSYTLSFNSVYGRKGSLFQKSFKRKLVENDSYFYHLDIIL